MTSLIFSVGLALFGTALQAQPGGVADEVVACMRANMPQTVRLQEVRLVSVDRSGGERILEGRMYGTREDDLVRVAFKVDAPPDLAGAAYLLREAPAGRDDEMFLYLPAINRVRRIRGGSADGQLFGTDLSYNDIKRLQNAMVGASVTHVGTTRHAGREVHHLRSEPGGPDEPNVVVDSLVDVETCVALQVEFRDAGGVGKRMSVAPAALQQANGKWYAERVRVDDLDDNTHTELHVTDVRFDEELSRRHFHQRTFHIGS